MIRQRISRLLNLLIFVIVLLAWLAMTFQTGRHGAFSAERLANLRYFTVLSNLFQGCVSLACACGAEVRRLKYASTTAVALTFFVVLLFLGPVFGFEGLYAGANYWFHLVVPLLAMADFLFLDRRGPIPFRDSFLATLPMLAYSAFYVRNLLVHGVRDNDWYGFAVGGPKSAALVFQLILAGNWALALLLRLPRRRE